jgi:DNA-binding transcriptional MocR family regulator
MAAAAARPATRPVYRGVVRLFEEGITAGSLAPGTRLPAERALALALRLSRATIVRAYRELESRGLVRGHVGRGTFVSAAPDASGAPFAWRGKLAASALRSTDAVIRDVLRGSSDPKLIAVAGGLPALECFPSDGFRRALDRALRGDLRTLWGLGPTEGQPLLREAIARRFGGRPENILILAGAQQGLDLIARCLVDPGDGVVIDRPGYLGAIHTFRAAGARLVGWDVGRHDLDELEDLFIRYRPKLLYTNPTFQNPTGWVMPLKVRRDLLRLAGRFRVPIVEDDTYRELHLSADPPPSLHALDGQSLVIHVGTFSKMMAPALRLGWMTAAEPIIEQLALIKQRADPQTQSLVQFVVADLIQNGTFDEHLVTLRAEHRARRDAVTGALERRGSSELLRWRVPDGGLYLWCRLRARVNAAAVLKRALADAVGLVHGEAFYVDRAGDAELRLCFSSIPPSRADLVAERLTRSIKAARSELAPPRRLVAVS